MLRLYGQTQGQRCVGWRKDNRGEEEPCSAITTATTG
jgi:hypothetical protein